MRFATPANLHRCRQFHPLFGVKSSSADASKTRAHISIICSRNQRGNGAFFYEDLSSDYFLLQIFSYSARGLCSVAGGKDGRRYSWGESFAEQNSINSRAFSKIYPFRPFLLLYRATNIMVEVTMLSFWHFFLKDIQWRAEKLRHCLIRLGPFYIKLGQALSTRPDMLPNAYCQELAKLQDQIPPFPSSIALRYIEAELGSPVLKLFAEISPEPVAAASLGQVYKARLHSGEAVAVKVQRPGMHLRLALDAYLLRMIGGQLRRFLGARGDIVVAVNEMVGHMFEEIDYIREGRNAERFAALYGLQTTKGSELGSSTNHGCKVKGTSPNGQKKRQRMANSSNVRESEGLVKVPKIFWDLSSKGVLTMEWIDGIKLTDKEALREANLDVQHLVDQGVFCSLRQLLKEGFFHGDPHPGNLVATKDGVLAYFDFGMMGDFPRHYRIGLIRTLVHFVNRDSWGLANDFLFLGFVPEGEDLELISRALQTSFGDESSKSHLDFQGIMNQLSNVMYEFKFTLPPEYAMVIRALGSLEGTAKVLDPDFKVIASAYPFIIGRLLSDPASDMRQILRELLIRNNGSIRWHRLERLVMAIAQHSLHSLPSKDTNAAGGWITQNGFGQTTSETRGLSFDTRAVASATADILTFILSEHGLQIRFFIVHDILKVFDTFLVQEVLGFLSPNGSSQMDADKDIPSVRRKRIHQIGDDASKDEEAEDASENSDFTNGENIFFGSRVMVGIIAFATAVHSAPEIWIPLLASFAIKPEAMALLATIMTYVTEISCNRTSEATWLLISRIIHEANC